MFPKGAHTGNFFHDLFEHLDYTSCSPQALRSPVQRSLQAYGFDSAWKGIISKSISHVLNVALKATTPELVLSSIAFENRINEMEFYFPINAISPSKLRTIFKRHESIDGIGDFPEQLQKLVFSPTAGFMKGYIDLVFEYQDQYYLLDWKSNYLGQELEDYRREALGHVMQDNYYTLQYHLYALALSQYLRLRNPGFQYESDFGGVFYIFIRGVDSRRGPQFGIFHDLPQPALINALGKALIPGFSKV
jgi:exodeoxyribonuclease V beta subunit